MKSKLNKVVIPRKKVVFAGRSRAGVPGLPQRRAPDAAVSTLGLPLLLHATLPRSEILREIFLSVLSK
jgi:hypothetical protein